MLSRSFSSLILSFGLIAQTRAFFSSFVGSNMQRNFGIFRRLTGQIQQSHLYSSSKDSSDGHQAPVGSSPTSTADELLLKSFREHQQSAARLTFAEEVRTLIDRSLCYGVLSTNSDQLAGYPTGSVVGFELDDSGLPFFVFSTMSSHTKDIAKDGRCSLTVLAGDFKGAAEGRVTLVGDVRKVDNAEKCVKLREKYLARHKDAYWIDFGDFSFYAMESLKTVRFVGGFAMAGSVTPDEYSKALPDPVAAFSIPVMKHMNEDHADATAAMVKHYTGISCSEAQIVSMDRLGMTVRANLEIGGGGISKVRLPYPRPVTERKGIKEVLVEMTRAASPAPSP